MREEGRDCEGGTVRERLGGREGLGGRDCEGATVREGL